MKRRRSRVATPATPGFVDIGSFSTNDTRALDRTETTRPIVTVVHLGARVDRYAKALRTDVIWNSDERWQNVSENVNRRECLWRASSPYLLRKWEMFHLQLIIRGMGTMRINRNYLSTCSFSLVPPLKSKRFSTLLGIKFIHIYSIIRL